MCGEVRVSWRMPLVGSYVGVLVIELLVDINVTYTPWFCCEGYFQNRIVSIYKRRKVHLLCKLLSIHLLKKRCNYLFNEES